MGIGLIVIGLASVIIGEAIFGAKKIVRATLAVIGGSILYRIIVTMALRVEFLDTGDMKLITAIIVIIALVLPKINDSRKEKQRKKKRMQSLMANESYNRHNDNHKERNEVIPLLQLKQIFKVFNEGTPDEKIALHEISLELEPGDFVTVIGSNGAGKSTLMNIISGKIFTDLGSVTIDGKDVTYVKEHNRAKLVGRVFQDPMAGTAPTMTIEENLAIAYSRTKTRGLRIGVSKKRRDFFKQKLETLHLGLENRLEAKVGLLSGGERQALSLLMATFTDPKILLLDEHTAALDPSRAELITNLTRDIVQNNNLTTLMVTHNMQQALDLGNRLIMMDKGQIIFEANKEEKQQLTVEKLLAEFQRIRGEKMNSDRAMLI